MTASFLRSAGQSGSRSRPHLPPLPMDAITLEAGQPDQSIRIVPRTRAYAFVRIASSPQLRVLGPDHPDTLTTRNSLADLVDNAG